MAKPASEDSFSARGDALLVLDSGCTLTVHSTFLEMRSQVLADAVALAADSAGQGSKLRVPLPSTSDAAARLLVRAMYSQQPETLLLALDMTQLLELARVCHRYALKQLLSLVDKVRSAGALACSAAAGAELGLKNGCQRLTHVRVQALAVICSPERTQCSLTDSSVLSKFQLARELGLQAYEAACVAFIAKNAKRVVAAQPDDPITVVLAGAIKGRFQGLTMQQLDAAKQRAIDGCRLPAADSHLDFVAIRRIEKLVDELQRLM